MARRTAPRYLAADGMKLCRICEETKPAAEFYERPGAPDGYRNECIACLKAKMQRWYSDNAEQVKTRVQQWQEANPERTRANKQRSYERRRLQWYEENREAILARERERRRTQPERYRAKDRKAALRAYGLTLESYEALLAEQGGVCAICGGPPNGKGSVYHVDHDHRTGRVRGLLCHYCNVAIGMLREDPALFERAVAYLRR